jgi:surface carbohydrate biosynthesis protein
MDDNYVFQKIALKYKNAKFIAIQNGTRQWKEGEAFKDKDGKSIVNYKLSLPPPHPGSKVHMPHFFCFGQNEVDHYIKYHKWQIDSSYRVGSLKAGYFQEQNPHPIIQHDVCVASGYSVNAGDTTDFWVNDGARKLCENLQKYVEGSGHLKIAIATRSAQDKESQFYTNYLGTKVRILPRIDEYSTYRVGSESNVVIGNRTTVLWELLGLRKKVLFLDYSGGMFWFHIFEDMAKKFPEAMELIYTQDESFPVFQEKLDRIISMSDEEYWEIVEEYRKYTMNINPLQPAHKLIRQTVLEFVGRTESEVSKT